MFWPKLGVGYRREAKDREDAKRAKELQELERVHQELERLEVLRAEKAQAEARDKEDAVLRRRAAAAEKAEERKRAMEAAAKRGKNKAGGKAGGDSGKEGLALHGGPAMKFGAVQPPPVVSPHRGQQPSQQMQQMQQYQQYHHVGGGAVIAKHAALAGGRREDPGPGELSLHDYRDDVNYRECGAGCEELHCFLQYLRLMFCVWLLEAVLTAAACTFAVAVSALEERKRRIAEIHKQFDGGAGGVGVAGKVAKPSSSGVGSSSVGAMFPPPLASASSMTSSPEKPPAHPAPGILQQRPANDRLAKQKK